MLVFLTSPQTYENLLAIPQLTYLDLSLGFSSPGILSGRHDLYCGSVIDSGGFNQL